MTPAIIRAKSITLQYGNKTILDAIDLSLPKHSIIGLVGINGSGKSSLIKILAGRIDHDEGEIIKAKTVTIHYVSQEFESPTSRHKTHALTCQEYLTYQRTATTHLQNTELDEERLYQERLNEYQQYFTLPSLDQSVDSLSGGQQRQLSLYHALALQPDILLLDEPTNHLDLTTMINLQSVFKNYLGTILMISHDRYFLDSCVDTIWELDNAQLYTHPGNYSHFLERKTKRRTDQTQMYLRLKQELKREHEWFISGVKARGTKDAGRLKRYYELKQEVALLKPRWKELRLPIPKPQPLGKKILNLKHLSIAFPHNNTVQAEQVDNAKPVENIHIKTHTSQPLIINDLTLEYQEGMRIGLLGPNGSGKTTFIRTLLGHHTKQSGTISYGQNTLFNYHDQSRGELDMQLTVHQTINEGNKELLFGERKINIFAYMKQFLFDSEDLTKYVSDLSGGERARLLLAKILKTGGNFLILDEPTNDLDLDTIQALENTLTRFAGCALIVSHDRFFLDTVCTHILAFEGGKDNNGMYTLSTGGYTRYITHYKKESEFWQQESKPNTILQTTSTYTATTTSTPHKQKNLNPLIVDPLTTSSDRTSTSTKPKQSTKEIRQIKAQIRTLESLISATEARINSMKIKIAQPEFYTQSHSTIIRSHANLSSLQEELHTLEKRWFELNEKLASPTI